MIEKRGTYMQEKELFVLDDKSLEKYVIIQLN